MFVPQEKAAQWWWWKRPPGSSSQTADPISPALPRAGTGCLGFRGTLKNGLSTKAGHMHTSSLNREGHQMWKGEKKWAEMKGSVAMTHLLHNASRIDKVRFCLSGPTAPATAVWSTRRAAPAAAAAPWDLVAPSAAVTRATRPPAICTSTASWGRRISRACKAAAKRERRGCDLAISGREKRISNNLRTGNKLMLKLNGSFQNDKFRTLTRLRFWGGFEVSGRSWLRTFLSFLHCN